MDLVGKESKLVFHSAGRGLCFYNNIILLQSVDTCVFATCSAFKFADEIDNSVKHKNVTD